MERYTHKTEVSGSSPEWPTTKFRKQAKFTDLLFVYAKQIRGKRIHSIAR